MKMKQTRTLADDIEIPDQKEVNITETKEIVFSKNIQDRINQAIERRSASNSTPSFYYNSPLDKPIEEILKDVNDTL